ncbi:MAG: lytic transglycosylase domain-containing protein [Alphaproteobacteria bacterium]|nr:MAG: lytic transglycosylase domain-containing protein [Alphaproteobacteria bacterium]
MILVRKNVILRALGFSHHFGKALLAVLSLPLSLFVTAPAMAQSLSAQDTAIYREAFASFDAGRPGDALAQAARASDPTLAQVLVGFDMARPETQASFATMQDFLDRHSDWPWADDIRREADRRLPSGLPPQQVVSWFASAPAQSMTGLNRHVDALRQLGQDQAARDLVRLRWVDTNYGPEEERELRQRYGAWLRPSDHAARLDRLLWDGRSDAARRLFPLVSSGLRAVAEARLALSSESSRAIKTLAKVPASLSNQPGLVYERVRWARRKGQTRQAISWLARQPSHTDHESEWWTERHILIRRLLEQGSRSEAYRLAAAHGLTGGEDMVEAEFLAGWLALRSLNQPKVAWRHFDRLQRAAGSTSAQARAGYWLGRTAEAMGNADLAMAWYGKAAAWRVLFYGQLAGMKLSANPVLVAGQDPITQDDVNAFQGRFMVRAVRQLQQIRHQPDRARTLLRAVGMSSRDRAAYVQAVALAHEMGVPELAVRIARDGGQKGMMMPVEGYPTLRIPLPSRPEAPLIHAIIRQESGFQTDAKSHAGARGLMQLMPATARQTASRNGLDNDVSDPSDNIRLGSAHLAELIDSYGSYPLSIAAYNAGGGNVGSMLRQFGDPRGRGLEAMVDWIESIPIGETRNYVHRVMESLQVYRARLGGGRSTLGLERDLTGK